MKQTLVGFGAFKNQKRLYFEGDYFSCEEIITFTANKLGGVHLDAKRNSRQEKLERAARFMTFGGPLVEADLRAGTELHLMVEPTSKEVFSGLHVEIIAAGASFLLNCTPFRPDSRHKQKGSSTGLRTGLCLTSIDMLNC